MIEQSVIEIKRINFDSYARTNWCWYDQNKLNYLTCQDAIQPNSSRWDCGIF
jgi:hypothetical protein